MNVGHAGVHCFGDNLVHEPDGGRCGHVASGGSPERGGGPFGESANPLHNLVFVGLDGLYVYARGDLQVVNQVVVPGIGHGYREPPRFLVELDGHGGIAVHEFLRQEPQRRLRGRILEFECHDAGAALLARVGLGRIHGDEANGDGPQDKLKRSVRIGDDVDGIFGEVAFLSDDNLVHVALFAGEDYRAAGICLEGLGGLDFVCQFYVGFLDRIARNRIVYDNRITYRDSGFGVVVLEAGGQQRCTKGYGEQDKMLQERTS